MKRRPWRFGLAVLAAVLTSAFFLILEAPIELQDLNGARTRIEVRGFSCTADRADGKISNGFLVSREPAHWQEANNLTKAGPMGLAWKGKVWICRPYDQPTAIMPSDAAARNWGGVYAFGDGDFLNEIESSLKWSRFRLS